MTIVGSGGIRFAKFYRSKRFVKEVQKLDAQLRARTLDRIEALLVHPFPSGVAFEKLSGYSDPDIYTIHVNGNYKVSLHAVQEIGGGLAAFIRRVGTHNEIDRCP